jgi:hypothetical protein
VEGVENRGEAVTDGKTLREQARCSEEEIPLKLFLLSFLGFGMGDFGKYKNTR